MRRLLNYLRHLNTGRVILWSYAIWYGVVVVHHFDGTPRLWITSIGLSGIIGSALLLGIRSSSKGPTKLEGWQIFRLYLMPFCVSSFSAMVKSAGFILVFPPSFSENAWGLGLIAAFVLGVQWLKRATPSYLDPSAGVSRPSETL